jgi:hypothetical protein
MTTSPTIEIANHQLSADIGVSSENARGGMMARRGFGDCAGLAHGAPPAVRAAAVSFTWCHSNLRGDPSAAPSVRM